MYHLIYRTNDRYNYNSINKLLVMNRKYFVGEENSLVLHLVLYSFRRTRSSVYRSFDWFLSIIDLLSGNIDTCLERSRSTEDSQVSRIYLQPLSKNQAIRNRSETLQVRYNVDLLSPKRRKFPTGEATVNRSLSSYQIRSDGIDVEIQSRFTKRKRRDLEECLDCSAILCQTVTKRFVPLDFYFLRRVD